MPSVIVDTPQFPTVPPLPGVPQLNTDPSTVFTTPVRAFSDGAGVSGGNFGASKWGIYTKNGTAALVADAVGAVEYSRDYAISDYPQTEGAFMSYNKVQRPYQAKVSYLVGSNRPGFLNQMEQVLKALDLYSVVTPDVTYVNANIIHGSYRRIASNGVSLIQAEVWVQEVRIVSVGKLSSGQSANSASTTQDGSVQSTQTTSATAADGNVSGFSTPSGMVAPQVTTPGTSTELSSTLSSEFGTKIVTEPLGVGTAEIQSGLPVLAPDVAIGKDGTTQIVPIPPPL